MSRKRKTNGSRTHFKPGSSRIHRRVQAMAARGLVEDQIALRLGSDKNQLRRRYIDAVKAARAEKQEAQAAAEAAAAGLTKEQQKTREVIRQTWDYWFAPELNSHLILEGARTPEEAIAMSEACQRAKNSGAEIVWPPAKLED